MAYEAVYTEQVSVFLDKPTKERIDRLVTDQDLKWSQSHVIRRALDIGMGEVEREAEELRIKA